MALATRTSPREWDAILDDDPKMVWTVIDLMKEANGVR